MRLGRTGLAVCWLATAFWALMLIVLPLLTMTDYAFRPFLLPSEWGGPKDVYTAANFETALLNPFNRAIFIRTIWASLLVTVIALVACYPVAYVMALAGRGAQTRWLALALLVPFWMSEILRAFAWQLLLAHSGLINQVLLALGLVGEPVDFLNNNVGVLVGLVYAYALFMIFPLYSAMESLDRNQIEAARDLGASWWHVHRDIVIPHAKPGIASGCILTFMLAAGSYAVPQILGGTRSLWFTQLIYNQFEAVNWNMGAAYAFCLVLLCLAFILGMMRLFRVTLRGIAR